MVNVETLVERMGGEKSAVKGSVDINQSTPPKISEIDVDGSCQISEVLEGDAWTGTVTREEVKQHVDRLRVQVEMMSRAEEQYVVHHDEKIGIDKLFTCREDFQVREDTIKYADGSEYTGQVLGKNLKHGMGTYKDASGAIYSGEFKYDVVDGNCKAVMSDGSTYEGEWIEGNPHGMGKSMYPQGGTYQGDFVKGGRHGWGVMNFLSGDVYEGEWECDKIHGQGRWTYSNDGSYFQGRFDCGARVHGTFSTKDGSEEYRGDWNGMIRHGKGMLYIRQVGKYDGEFKDNVPDGQGTFNYVDGSVYNGMFAKGVRCGKGCLKLGDVLSYQGQWENDAMHGVGYLIEDGNTYFGEFSAGKKQGKGKMTFQNGTVYEGDWSNDKRHGHGKCSYDNGDTYTGEWKDDKRNGQGKCKFADGTVFRGIWEDDGWIQSGADPSQTRIGGAGIVRAQVGQVGKFVIQARDSIGNKRLSGGDEFQVQLVLHGQCGNPEVSDEDIISVTGTVKDKGDGTYEVSYESQVAGVYELSILTEVTQEDVADSPYPVRILPGPPCFTKSLFKRVEHAMQAGQQAEFEILVRDNFGNCCSGHNWQNGFQIQVSLHGQASGPVDIPLVATTDGRLLCSFRAPDEPGHYRICIEDGKGKAAPGTPFAVRVTSPEKGEEIEDNSSEVAARIMTVSSKWEQIAKESYMAIDGNVTGWDSDDEGHIKSGKQSEHLASNPDVPVVENLEDLWLVSKLQQERKRKEEQEKQEKLKSMKTKLEDIYGPPTEIPTIEEAQVAMKEIVLKDSSQMMEEIMATSSASVQTVKCPRRRSSLAASLDDLA